MRQLTAIIIAFSLFTLLLSPSIVFAKEISGMEVEGILQDIIHIPGENIQIQLDDNWYSIDDNSDIYVCGEKQQQKTLKDIPEFLNYRLSLTPSSDKTYNKIHVMCE